VYSAINHGANSAGRAIGKAEGGFAHDLALQQPIPVLGEGRVVPGAIIDPQVHEPAEQKIKLKPLP